MNHGGRNSGSSSKIGDNKPAPASSPETQPKIHPPFLQSKTEYPSSPNPRNSFEEPSKKPSSEMVIKSDYQDTNVVVTDKDVKKSMTEGILNKITMKD